MRLFGLIGYPLTHSFSKKYFSEKFKQENIHDADYELFEIDNINLFPEIIKSNPSICGLNVTIPYKEAVIPFLDALDAPVKDIYAVNVIKVEKDGSLKGYNSDYHGFRDSLLKFIDAKKDLRALVLGTGGASKAILAALKDLTIPYLLVSRNSAPEKNIIAYTDLDKEILSTHKLIINTTPLGMYPNTDTAPEIPYEHIGENHFLFDLVYNPIETSFMKRGLEKGAKTKNGLEMLYLQAEKAWEIWNG
jgi:shikimate dehydrogenase